MDILENYILENPSCIERFTKYKFFDQLDRKWKSMLTLPNRTRWDKILNRILPRHLDNVLKHLLQQPTKFFERKGNRSFSIYQTKNGVIQAWIEQHGQQCPRLGWINGWGKFVEMNAEPLFTFDIHLNSNQVQSVKYQCQNGKLYFVIHL